MSGGAGSGGGAGGGGDKPGFFAAAFAKGGTALVQMAVVSAGVFLFTFGANWVTDGGLIRVLGGVPEAEVAALTERLAAAEEALAALDETGPALATIGARVGTLEERATEQGLALDAYLDHARRLTDIEGRVEPNRVHESLVDLLGHGARRGIEDEEEGPVDRLALSEEIDEVSRYINDAKQLCHEAEVFRFCLSGDRCEVGSAEILRHPTPISLRPVLNMTKGDWLVATAWEHVTADLIDANGNRVIGEEGRLNIYTPNDAEGIEVFHDAPARAVAGYEDFRIEYIYYDADSGYSAPCTVPGEGG
ncbi:MAG: hypothetical protein AAF371_12835 [Pseudomonadota bacterium]